MLLQATAKADRATLGLLLKGCLELSRKKSSGLLSVGAVSIGGQNMVTTYRPSATQKILGSSMNLVSTGAFDRFQQALTIELLRTIKLELEKVDAPEEMVHHLTGRIGFAVASLIDDTAGFEASGESVSPILTFRTSEKTLEFCGGNSYLHEYVDRLLPRLFEPEV